MLGGALDAGIVECGAANARWLPYVEVEEIDAMTERGRRLGAPVLLEPREGPAGWRSVFGNERGRRDSAVGAQTASAWGTG